MCTISHVLQQYVHVTIHAMSPGTIVSWEKAEGEEIEDGDVLAQVETDKATMDMEAPRAGYLAKIIMPAGSKDIALGKVRVKTLSTVLYQYHMHVYSSSVLLWRMNQMLLHLRITNLQLMYPQLPP